MKWKLINEMPKKPKRCGRRRGKQESPDRQPAAGQAPAGTPGPGAPDPVNGIS